MTQAAAKPRITYLDTVKGFAILSVVLLHLSTDEVLLKTLAPWHIWQAMPLFLMVAGITAAMVWKKYQGNLASYYRDLPPKILTLYIPYAAATVIYYMVTTGQSLSIDLFFNTMIMGYLGPGGYFVPLIITHLIVFPPMLALRDKIGNDKRFLAVALLINIVLELLFAFADVEATRFGYRIFYFRYLFIACVGAVLSQHNPFSKTTFRVLAALGAFYIFLTCYVGWNLPIIRSDDWYFQHYPVAFYTAFLVFGIRDIEQRIPFLNFFIALGKSSYEIFIVQLLFFITLYQYLDSNLFLKVISLIICLGGGLAYTAAKKRWAEIKKIPK